MNDKLEVHSKRIVLRAIKCHQGGTDLYSFFIPGHLLTEIADISRLKTADSGKLEGFQRKEIKDHIKEITRYLDQGDVLFPNSIILALSSEIEFKQARGRDPENLLDAGQIGTLIFPINLQNKRFAWIVDGQQRVMALSQTTNKSLVVPVIAFVAPDITTQREQFILVNKARPLPTRLINELLPEVDIRLPRDLASRKIPSELCRLLNTDPHSPFYQRIKLPSEDNSSAAVISDTAIIEMIRRSINEPLGALSKFRGLPNDPYDTEAMYQALLLFWKSLAQTFPDAWMLPPSLSRLTHSVGIKAMGVLMDRLIERVANSEEKEKQIKQALSSIRPHCHWTEGTWDGLGYSWNDLQNVSRHVRLLTDHLLRLDAMVNMRGAK